MLTDSGFGFDSGSNSLRVASSGTISRALSAHPAGLRSTHCVFPPQSPGGLLLPVVLAPVLFASLFVQPCILHHASNTHIVTNRIRKHVHGHQSQPCTNIISIHEFLHRIVISCTHTNMSLWPSSPRIILRLRFQRGVAVVVAKMCYRF